MSLSPKLIAAQHFNSTPPPEPLRPQTSHLAPDRPTSDTPYVYGESSRGEEEEKKHRVENGDGAPARQDLPSPEDEESESEDARIEHLGRQRPEKFKTMWAEFMFCYSILASEFMAVS